MTSEPITAAITRVQSLTSDVDSLRRSIDAQDLPLNDRQYLSRCFDLLEMELTALRDYLGGLSS
ncbi:MAG TPA: hypothetical protein VF787_07465 [Thermoanaerobaculia bacterium]